MNQLHEHPEWYYNALTENCMTSALTSNLYSSMTAVVLHRHGLEDKDFVADSELFIRKLHNIAANDERRDLLLSLSELCFLTAQKAEADQKQQVFDNSNFIMILLKLMKCFNHMIRWIRGYTILGRLFMPICFCWVMEPNPLPDHLTGGFEWAVTCITEALQMY